MKLWMLVLTVGILCAAPAGFDPRLTVHTLVREDIFAGLLANDTEQLARGEKTLELLLADRPDSRPSILAWQGSAALYRAVRAHEAKQPEVFTRSFERARDLFGEAMRLAPQDVGVTAIRGGSLVVLADRLPPEHRAEAWQAAYQSFQALWKAQGAVVEKLPLHIKGELLAGLTMSAERTGHKEETALYLEKMLTLLASTPYESRARKWKENPDLASRTSVACQSCHEPGRLEARKAALK